ncbi:hypothetical protein M2451_003634 [Dysgonomonas sp. PFB1-18]|nr:hypothetical protein [Dysgonomonas sp. PF1-14]MDH6340600.1 hypothetical protein [Dysgonomonas sp. PF1-16]MDH6382293.1 hypothetical protein [Dysgonomonas sp. PFB1-18]MDH6399570.1 hypothetical protein [Dysgonomonas sp. PF1-23]
MKLKLYILITLIIFNGCSNNKSVSICENCNLDSIKVYYYNYSFMSPLSIKCSDIEKSKSMPFNGVNKEYEGIVNHIITDCDILKNIDVEIKNLQPKDFPASRDARILCIIYYKDGTMGELCLCQDSDVKYIYKNGALQDYNFSLIYLIKKNSAYYEWFTEEEK